MNILWDGASELSIGICQRWNDIELFSIFHNRYSPPMIYATAHIRQNDECFFFGFSDTVMHTKPIEFNGTSAWIIDERLLVSPRFVKHWKLYMQTHGKTTTTTTMIKDKAKWKWIWLHWVLWVNMSQRWKLVRFSVCRSNRIYMNIVHWTRFACPNAANIIISPILIK